MYNKTNNEATIKHLEKVINRYEEAIKIGNSLKELLEDKEILKIRSYEDFNIFLLDKISDILEINKREDFNSEEDQELFKNYNYFFIISKNTRFDFFYKINENKNEPLFNNEILKEFKEDLTDLINNDENSIKLYRKEIEELK